jgi:hypothetical protein
MGKIARRTCSSPGLERVDAAYGAQERFLHEVVRTVDFATEWDRERAQARNGSQHGVTHGWLKRISSAFVVRIVESLVGALGCDSDAAIIFTCVSWGCWPSAFGNERYRCWKLEKPPLGRHPVNEAPRSSIPGDRRRTQRCVFPSHPGLVPPWWFSFSARTRDKTMSRSQQGLPGPAYIGA